MCDLCVVSKSAAKLQQNFGIHKDLAVKMKIYLFFMDKDLLFAQKCDRNFGGTLLFVVGRTDVTIPRF